MDAGPVPGLPFPLFAVDFVLGKEMYAIDLNVAPGVRETGVEKWLPPKMFYDALEDTACGL